MAVARGFPATTLVWHHGGMSPQVAGSLPTRHLLTLYTNFLRSGKDKNRYIEMSQKHLERSA